MPASANAGWGRRVRDGVRIAAPVVAATAGLAALKLVGPDYVDQKELVALFHRVGPWAPLAFVAFLAVRPVALLPGQLLTAVGGLVFGALWGTVYALIGSLLSTSLVFFIGTRVGSRPMRRIVGHRYDAVRQVARRHDLKFAALCTLNPLLPTDLIVAVMSASGGRYAWTVLGVFAGTIPGTIVTAEFGSAVGRGNLVMTIFAAVAVAVSLALGIAFSRNVSRELQAAQKELGAKRKCQLRRPLLSGSRVQPAPEPR